MQTRLQFANANIAGKLFYMMPLYVGLNTINKNKLHKIIMRSTRCILNNYSYRNVSNESLLSRIQWFDIDECIKYSALKYIHAMIIYNS